jgi:hypothetical protein
MYVVQDGKGMKPKGSRTRQLSYKQKKHIRWNIEYSKGEEFSKYHFSLFAPKKEINPSSFVSNLFLEWGHFNLDLDSVSKLKIFNKRFSYQNFSVISDRRPESLHWEKIIGYEIIKDENLNSKGKITLEEYVDELYKK